MNNKRRIILTVVSGLIATMALVGLQGSPQAVSPKAVAKIGAAAPDFKGVDTNGKDHKLSQYRGKYVVLEWLNHGCPYVQKHYGSNNMQALQAEWVKKGVVWLSIVNSAEGAAANDTAKEKGAKPTAILMDSKGSIGKTYGAKTTPHMFVIDPKGKLIYMGAIDDRPTTEEGDVEGATNYVSAALQAAMDGKTIAVTSTKSYGCGVKY